MDKQEARRQYGKILLLEIHSDRPYDWEVGDATHIRACLPTSYDNQREMLARGFFPADRTLDVSIGLVRTKLDFGALTRTQPRRISDRRDEVLAIARESFPNDRRFHLSPAPDRAISDEVLAVWVAALSDYYVFEHKGQIIGFLALTGEGDTRSVHLAAVLEKYRASGAALSLYAAAVRDCQAAGLHALHGRVSTANPAVMDLYAFLGAKFSAPTDVFLKEV